MNIPLEPEPPKNILRKTVIFLLVLLVIWIIGAIYVLTPRPFTDDPEVYEDPNTLSQQLTIS